jgi:uncharacterized protein YbjQ (UPF0145 family)
LASFDLWELADVLQSELNMLLTTTPGIDGKSISVYLGIVTGEAIVGANIFRDLFANIRDIVGGRSGAYERELERARQLALEDVQLSAQQLGADAVVGIDFDYEVLFDLPHSGHRCRAPEERRGEHTAVSEIVRPVRHVENSHLQLHAIP